MLKMNLQFFGHKKGADLQLTVGDSQLNVLGFLNVQMVKLLLADQFLYRQRATKNLPRY